MSKWVFGLTRGDVFIDIVFSPPDAAELCAKSALIEAIDETSRARGLTQRDAVCLCGTDPPTLSKVLRGRMKSITIDRRATWLTALGRTLELCIRPYDDRSTTYDDRNTTGAFIVS